MIYIFTFTDGASVCAEAASLLDAAIELGVGEQKLSAFAHIRAVSSNIQEGQHYARAY